MKSSPVNDLRFITRDGKTVLQQLWRTPETYRDNDGELQLDFNYDWRDVPTLPNDPGPYA